MDYSFDTCKSFLCWRSQNEVDPNITCKLLITTLIDFSVANYFFSLQSFIPFIYGHREGKLLQSRFAKLLKEDLVSKMCFKFYTVFFTVHFTVWKFHDFCTIEILREINFEDSRSAKSAILTHFCTFWRLKFTKWTNFPVPKMAKTADFAL